MENMRLRVPVLGCATVLVGYALWRRRRSRVPLAFHTCVAHCVQDGDRAYKLLVSVPLRYRSSKARYPVLFALDGEPYLFPLLTTCVRTNNFMARSYYYPDAIVVGVVADLEREARFYRWCRLDVFSLWDSLRPTRARDYLPTNAESPWGAPGAPSLLGIAGHADEFVQTLANTIVPFIDRHYRVDTRRRAIIGKSFGGSGVAHAMIDDRCARLFSQFVLGSPSISWDDHAFFRLEAEARAAAAQRGEQGSPPYAADVFCCVGSEEGAAPDNAARLKAVLDGRTGPRGEATVDVVPSENHGSVSYPFVSHALDWLKERWHPLEVSTAAPT